MDERLCLNSDFLDLFLFAFSNDTKRVTNLTSMTDLYMNIFHFKCLFIEENRKVAIPLVCLAFCAPKTVNKTLPY